MSYTDLFVRISSQKEREAILIGIEQVLLN